MQILYAFDLQLTDEDKMEPGSSVHGSADKFGDWQFLFISSVAKNNIG